VKRSFPHNRFTFPWMLAHVMASVQTIVQTALFVPCAENSFDCDSRLSFESLFPRHASLSTSVTLTGWGTSKGVREVGCYNCYSELSLRLVAMPLVITGI